MGTKEKLIERLKSIPKDFTIDEMQTTLGSLGFLMAKPGKTSGSRVRFVKENIPIILHRPHPGNELKEYQIKQVLTVLEKEGLI